MCIFFTIMGNMCCAHPQNNLQFFSVTLLYCSMSCFMYLQFLLYFISLIYFIMAHPQYREFFIYHGNLSPNNSQKTPHSSPVKVRYGVSLWVHILNNFNFLPIVLCSVSCYIRPRYIETIIPLPLLTTHWILPYWLIQSFMCAFLESSEDVSLNSKDEFNSAIQYRHVT